MDPQAVRSCLREAALLQRLRHPAIIELEAVFLADATVYLQMPFCAFGGLQEWVSPVLKLENRKHSTAEPGAIDFHTGVAGLSLRRVLSGSLRSISCFDGCLYFSDPARKSVLS